MRKWLRLNDSQVKALGMAGAALLLAGILFLVSGGPMNAPAAGSGGVAPVRDSTGGGWTHLAGFAFIAVASPLLSVWSWTYVLPKLRKWSR
jgi:hypothetical protein